MKKLEDQVEQLQKDVAELQKVNGIEPHHENVDNSDQEKPTIASDKTNNASKSNKDRAIEAIKYCLKMYQPSLKYTDIRGMQKPDGSVDVIIDYKRYGDAENSYYNVSVYNDGTFKINSFRGIEGRFPYGDKFTIE